VKLLFDQNLSRHLVDRLAMEYPGSRHVTQLGLETATDAEIWRYAGEHAFVITSKDSDFRQLAFLHGPPPKAVWLRVGNVSTNDVHQLLAERYDALDHFASTSDEALLVLSADVTGATEL
jgi:predicted nuclease of predicted toxin-antitoxin system